MWAIVRVVILSVLAGFWGSVFAEEPSLHYNQVRFHTSASQTVANDRMRAVLNVQDEGVDAAQLADRVNKTMAWALDQGKGRKGVDVRSGGYMTQPVYSKNVLTGWRANQELILEGGDFGENSRLIGVLQQRLQLVSVNFDVAPETRVVVERELIDQALDNFKARADQIRMNVGKTGYRIVELNVLTPDVPVQPLPMMRGEVMSMQAVTAPSFEGGDSEVRVSVQGTVQLQ